MEGDTDDDGKLRDTCCKYFRDDDCCSAEENGYLTLVWVHHIKILYMRCMWVCSSIPSSAFHSLPHPLSFVLMVRFSACMCRAYNDHWNTWSNVHTNPDSASEWSVHLFVTMGWFSITYMYRRLGISNKPKKTIKTKQTEWRILWEHSRDWSTTDPKDSTLMFGVVSSM